MFHNIRSFAACWFTRDEYTKMMDYAPKESSFFPSYDRWLSNADAQIEVSRAEGHSPEKVNIQAADLQDFCEDAGRRPDLQCQAEVAAMTLRRRMSIN